MGKIFFFWDPIEKFMEDIEEKSGENAKYLDFIKL